MRKRLGSFLRLFFALSVLAAVFSFVGVTELLEVVQQIQLEYIAYLLLFSIVLIWASVLKWRLFIRAGGHDVPLLHLMKLYTMGYFFNTFTPSYVGGDVARSFHLGKYLSSQKDAFVATFLERFTGLIAMACLGTLFVLVGSNAAAGVEIAVLCVAAGTFVLALTIFSQRLSEIAFAIGLRVIRAVGLKKFAGKIEKLTVQIHDAMEVARTDPLLFLKAMLLSFLFHSLTIINIYIAARSIGWQDPDIAGLFVVSPLVLLVSMAPLTPSGLGIQEGAFLFFLQRIGGTKGQGLGVGLVLRAKITVLALIGGVLWLCIRQQIDSQEEKGSRVQKQ